MSLRCHSSCEKLFEWKVSGGIETMVDEETEENFLSAEFSQLIATNSGDIVNAFRAMLGRVENSASSLVALELTDDFGDRKLCA